MALGGFNILNIISSSFSNFYLNYDVILIAFLLAVASLFIFFFFKSTSKMNIIDLNLNKYNLSRHPLARKTVAILFFLLEYIIIMPIILMLWFTALSIILLFIARERSIEEILFISAALIGAIRFLAYLNREISIDLAKLFPFIALSVFLLSPGVFDPYKFISQISQVPLLLSNTLSFFVSILIVEVILRFIYTLYEFWQSEDVEE